MSLPLEVEMRLVKELENAMTAFWEPHGFYRRKKHEWVRRWGWKTDWICVVHTKHWDVLINFYIILPFETGSRVYEYVAMTNLGLLAGQEIESRFPFPRFSWTAGRYVPNIMKLMPLAVSWYDRLDTSTKCLEWMRADPNVNQDSPSFKYCQRYLQNLPENAAKGCCLLNLEREYYDEYCRSLFDVRWKGPLGKMKDDEPEPQFTVGAKVVDEHGMEATIVAIDRDALDGHGMLTARFEDGSETNLPLDDSDLSIDHPGRRVDPSDDF